MMNFIHKSLLLTALVCLGTCLPQAPAKRLNGVPKVNAPEENVDVRGIQDIQKTPGNGSQSLPKTASDVETLASLGYEELQRVLGITLSLLPSVIPPSLLQTGSEVKEIASMGFQARPKILGLYTQSNVKPDVNPQGHALFIGDKMIVITGDYEAVKTFLSGCYPIRIIIPLNGEETNAMLNLLKKLYQFA